MFLFFWEIIYYIVPGNGKQTEIKINDKSLYWTENDKFRIANRQINVLCE
jgi:hypothetical protein